jgi:hypothetical protein
MNESRWQEVLDLVTAKFNIVERRKEPLDGQALAGQALAGQALAGQALAGQALAGQALAGQGEKEIVIFEHPTLGKIKLEFSKRPKVLEKIIHFHRKKVDAQTEYVFSPDEFSFSLAAFRFNKGDQEWQEISGEELLS